MNKFISALCATAISVTMAGTSFVPAQAAPLSVMPSVPQSENGVIDVRDQYFRHGGNRFGRYGGRDRGDYYGRGRHNGGYYGRSHYRDRGLGLGGAAIGGLITGAIIGSALNNSGPVYRERVYRGGGNAHVQWCFDRYRTYRASDNTYVPRAGVRAYCNSPYN